MMFNISLIMFYYCLIMFLEQDFNDYVWAAVSVDWSIPDSSTNEPVTHRVQTLYSLTFSHIEHKKNVVDKKEKQQFSAAAGKEKKNPKHPRENLAAKEEKGTKKKTTTTVSGMGPSSIMADRKAKVQMIEEEGEEGEGQQQQDDDDYSTIAAAAPLSVAESQRMLLEFERQNGTASMLSGSNLPMGDAFGAAGRIFC